LLSTLVLKAALGLGARPAARSALVLFGPRPELESTNLEPNPGRPTVRIVLVPGEQVPGDDGKLAGDGNDRHVPAAPGGDALGEGMERTGRPAGDPGRLDEDLPATAAPCLLIRP
jgi:hypothetical protein